jgi:hypothetical protein
MLARTDAACSTGEALPAAAGHNEADATIMGIEWQLSEKRFSSIHLGLFVRARQAWSLGVF